jgi:signal transduction histidine kinase
MKNSSPIAGMSLKTKMILSYLFVIVGTVIVLSMAITAAEQKYFYDQQMQDVQRMAVADANQLGRLYVGSGYNWNFLRSVQVHLNPESIFDLSDGSGTRLACVDAESHGFGRSQNCASSVLVQITQRTLQTQQMQRGDIDLVVDDRTVKSVYASVPIQVQSSTSASPQTIGFLTVSEPLLSLSGLFLQTNQTILLAGAGVALVAMFCSFLLVRRFVRPLENLTRAAGLVKQGQYAQRVIPPNSQDELGRLALTFNEMADTIEADVNELRQQDQLRRDLVANIAHDLATPLTAIQGFSEALADDVITDPAARQETAQRIGREVQRLRRMVAEIRQMSSLEAGQAKLDLAPLDMQSLVDETLAVIAPECEHKGITVHNDIPNDTPAVLADGDRITQVLLNLLDNARRHTSEGGMLRVSAQVSGPSLFIWILDTGTGINRQDLPHIFERFYRADRARATTTGGSGLGLAIVKAIITAHRGNVWAESIAGKGTRIMFTLPLAPGQIIVEQRRVPGRVQTAR